MIGSNSKVPKIKNSLGEARRYVLAGVDMEEEIKAKLKKTENQVSNIDKLFTVAHKLKRESR